MRQIFMLFVLTSFISFGQDTIVDKETKDTLITNWHVWFKLNLNFNAVSFFNWDAGGDPMFSGLSTNTVFAQYKDAKFLWLFKGDITYGSRYLPDETEFQYRKTADILTFKNEFGYNLNPSWALVNSTFFQTQFTYGHKYNTDSSVVTRSKETNFMAPGYFNTSIGGKYNWKDKITIGVFPLAFKMTTVMDPDIVALNKYNGLNSKGLAMSFGYTLTSYLRFKFWEDRFYIQNEINAFGNYQDIAEVQVFWNTSLGLNLWNILNIEIMTNFIYDSALNLERDDGSFGPAAQFKQAYLLGIGYNFDNQQFLLKKRRKKLKKVKEEEENKNLE
jgi:hypothetical protein